MEKSYKLGDKGRRRWVGGADGRAEDGGGGGDDNVVRAVAYALRRPVML